MRVVTGSLRTSHRDLYPVLTVYPFSKTETSERKPGEEAAAAVSSIDCLVCQSEEGVL